MQVIQTLPHPVIGPEAPELSIPAETHECRCGHASLAHEHYRRGSDCAFCACSRFRGSGSLLWRRGLRHERYGAA